MEMSFLGMVKLVKPGKAILVCQIHWHAAGKCCEDCFTINSNWTWSFLWKIKKTVCIAMCSSVDNRLENRRIKNVIKVCKMNNLNGKSMNEKGKVMWKLQQGATRWIYKIKMRRKRHYWIGLQWVKVLQR